jgi:hypothetical protein
LRQTYPEFNDAMIKVWYACFEAERHARTVHLHQHLVAQGAGEIIGKESLQLRSAGSFESSSRRHLEAGRRCRRSHQRSSSGQWSELRELHVDVRRVTIEPARNDANLLDPAVP